MPTPATSPQPSPRTSLQTVTVRGWPTPLTRPRMANEVDR